MDIAELKDRLKLYLILETKAISLPLGDFLIQAIEGGVTAVQLRDKGLSNAERYETGRQIASLLEGRDTLFIVNNTVDLAKAVGAHGVHVGIHDLPPAVIKQNFPELIVGYSCNALADVDVAKGAGADYIGIGPAYATDTKTDLRPFLTVPEVNDIALAAGMPSVVIGGINTSNASNFTNSAVSGLAVSSALCTAEQPYEAAQKLLQLFNRDI